MDTDGQYSHFRDLTPILSPRSIAVIGASEQPGNLGGIAVQLLRKFGYPGKIWPVNPKRSSVHGLPCMARIGDLGEPADLALIATGVNTAAENVRECAGAGIRYGIVWGGGYSEIGDDGAASEAHLLSACRGTGFTLVGPNCIGIINTAIPMVASFASFLVETDHLIAGNIAMVSQSGGLATMAQATAQQMGAGFRMTISSGNEAMLTAADYVNALALDPGTKVIALYIEGIRDGDRFIAAVRAAKAAGKPVVVLKGGMTATSARAAAAHTGALAGERRVWEGVASELGLISVASLEELLDVALFLSRTNLDRLPKGKGIATVSFGGGSGVLSADQCAVHGLEMTPLQPETVAKLRPLVPPIAAIKNPIDLTPQVFNQEMWFATFSQALDTIAADPGIDILFCQFGPMAQRGIEIAEIASDLRDRTGKTVCIAWPLAPSGVPEVLDRNGVFVFEEYERAISVLGKLAHAATTPVPECRQEQGIDFDWSKFIPAPTPNQIISENDCHRILAAAGIATARGVLAKSEGEAQQAARVLGLPLALKGISAKVTHRAQAGLLALDRRTEADVSSAYARLVQTAAKAHVELDGIYLQQMIPNGIEVIVAAFRDPIFGPMVSLGSGGNLAEIIDDVRIARAPLDETAAKRLLQELRIVRGSSKLEPGVNIDDLARFVSHFSRVAQSAPWRRYVIEINPVKWRGDGVTAVDGLLIIEEP